MKNPFHRPFIAFYPVVSRDGMDFPLNKHLRGVHRVSSANVHAWRGDIVVGKYQDLEYSAMVDMSIADFPLIKNYFVTHSPDLNM